MKFFKINIYILLCLLILSTALNILCIANVISEAWAKIGYIIFMSYNTFSIITIYLKRNEPKPAATNKGKVVIFLAVVTLIAWVISYCFIVFR